MACSGLTALPLKKVGMNWCVVSVCNISDCMGCDMIMVI